jgi:hypothetical protein
MSEKKERKREENGFQAAEIRFLRAVKECIRRGRKRIESINIFHIK